MLSLLRSGGGGRLRRVPAKAVDNSCITVRNASVTCSPPINRMSSGVKMALGGIVFLSMYISAFAGVFMLPSWRKEEGSEETTTPKVPPKEDEETKA